ncbi:TetR/AcrR family transcriptional regulator [Microbispora sp. ZYX-F-249]|uniref:TetR/AcrR family transcriptional regulator n=1 Tax=Microbispora maris TaxID=3144104 RepID=A0ABV0AEF3_9ACTN
MVQPPSGHDGRRESQPAAISRPRLRPHVTDAVLDAVLAELAEVGYGRLTMEGVAQRAGSSKSTLYRRWSSKSAMALDAITTVSQASIPGDDDGGDLLDHLLTVARGIHEWLTEPLVSRIVPDLIAEGVRSSSMARALIEHVAEPRRRTIRRILESARTRGDVRADADLELALDMLVGLIYWRACVLREEIGEDYLEKVARVVHRDIATPA